MPDLLFEMNTGVSGDMILGGLFDLGLDFSKWKAQIKKLGLKKVTISKKNVIKNGIKAVSVTINTPLENKPRHLSHIVTMAKQAGFSKEVEKNIIKIFTRLAKAEAKVHDCDIESVHFHEVGADDSIVDIVGACIGFDMLNIDNFLATPLVFGFGEIETSHGLIPVPCPATLELSRRFPSRRKNIESELSTPTGTAIVTTLAKPDNNFGNLTISRIGYGAGSKQFGNTPNVLRLSLLDKQNSDTIKPDEKLYQIECNLDDMSPEILGFVTNQLLEAGCQDVWQEPIYMKKNRAAVKLCVLSKNESLKEVLSIVARETSTGGLRYYPVNRIIAQKKMGTVKTQFGDIKVKKIKFGHPFKGVTKITPEYEACRQLALKKKIPLHIVYSEVSNCLNRI